MTKMRCKGSDAFKKEQPFFVSVSRPPIWKGFAWIQCPDLKVPWTRRTMWETHQGSQASPKPNFIVFLGGGESCCSEKFPRFLWLVMNWRSFPELDGRSHRSPPASQRGSRCVPALLQQRKEYLEEKTSLGSKCSGFILQISRLSFSDLPVEGAQPPAVPALQIGVFSHPPPRRQLGPATDFGGFWVHRWVQGSL